VREITERIRSEARRLLNQQYVDLVIGYEAGWNRGVATPCFVTQAQEADRLIFGEHCTHNLAKYLVGREGYLTSRYRAAEDRVRVAIVARPTTLTTIVGLIQECQFKREDLTILGITDGTVVGIEPDITVGRIAPEPRQEEDVKARIRDIENLRITEREAWWNSEFSRCIRCYACRQVCPFCYCEQCIAEQNRPQWIDRSTTLENNVAWNLARAYHLVGRCTGCGECDRVCPARIPLSVLNAKMAIEVEEAFGYVAGTDPGAVPPLAAFGADDSARFIR
jgi:ferredoxin